jgi:hypothetical protein
MPLSGNPITFLQLQTEFGGTATDIALGNYYAGGVRVPAGTPGYPNGGGPTGAGFVNIPASGALSLQSFYASAKLTVATYDLQFGSRLIDTSVVGTWTVPRVIVGDITITVIGGGGVGAGGPSNAGGGGGGGGAIRVISGADLFRSISPGQTITYQAGKRGAEITKGDFRTSTQEWYINAGGGGNASGRSGGGGGVGSGKAPTYGTLGVGNGGSGNSGTATGLQGGGAGGAQGGGAAGGAKGFGGRGGPGNSGTGNIWTNATYMGVWPGGGGGGTDYSNVYGGAYGAGGAVRIQGTWAY